MQFQTVSVKVFNLATEETRIYTGITPRQAVRNAYAQERGDYNTWTYGRYDALVQEGEKTVACGNWCALKESK